MRCGQHPAAALTGARGWIALMAALLCAACSINPKVDLQEVTGTADARQLESVPFFPQTEYQCGPAALAGVLGASEVDITAEELVPQVYLPERRGSLQVELLAASRRAGRLPYVVDSEVHALTAELEAGRPVLLLQNLRTRHFPVWHYAVLVGMDPSRNEFTLNSGTEERLVVPAPRLLRTWDWGGRWGMVVLRPGELPARADPLRCAQGVAAFEQVAGPASAIPAWQAAIQAWPDDYRHRLALGNIYLAMDDPAPAIEQFWAGLQLAPGNEVLENNLAMALAAAGCPRTAESGLLRAAEALDPASPWHDEIHATLADIRAMRGDDAPHCRTQQQAQNPSAGGGQAR